MGLNVKRSIVDWLAPYLHNRSRKAAPGDLKGKPMSVKRGVVISNCQCQPLKHAMTLQCADVRFELFGVHLIAPDRRDEEVAAFVAKARTDYDVILSIPLSDEFGAISLNQIRETFSDKFVGTISNVFFAGLHPDLTYIGGLAQRVEGPLGDYHSRIALLCYLRGQTVAETLALFRHETYEAMGYYDAYATSLAELVHRDAGVDVSIAPDLPRLLREDLCFLSVNHPTSWLFSSYSATVARWLEKQGVTRMSGWASGPMGMVNHLASAAIYPIYPEIAARHGLARPGSYVFQSAMVGDVPATCFDLGAFITASFAAYDQIGRDVLAQSHQGREVMFKHAAIGL
jgi:hypothetical protein